MTGSVSLRTMPRLKAPAFLGNFGKSSSKVKTQNDSDHVTAVLSLASLARQCLDGESPALFRSFGGSVSLIVEGLKMQAAMPESIAQPLRAATEFLSGGEDPEHRLEFMLTSHTDQAALCEFVGHMENIIWSVFHPQGIGKKVASLYDVQSQWRRDLQVFRERCQEAWEIHLYFVFLDLKGDGDLLTATAIQLQSFLGTSAAGLAGNLRHTGRWVEAAFKTLAGRRAIHVLRVRHKEALQKWLSAAKTSAEAAQANFSELYFCNVFKISWPDFAEGFSEHFCQGRCPQDVLERLRLRVAVTCKHQVASLAWENLVSGYGATNQNVVYLLQSLTDEVLEDLDAHIYIDNSNLPTGAAVRPAAKVVIDGTRESAAAFASNDLPTQNEKQSTEGVNNNPAAAKDDFQKALALGMEDGVATSVTPQDPRIRRSPAQHGGLMDWSTYAEQLCLQKRPWWVTLDTPVSMLLAETGNGQDGQEPLRISAIRAVKGNTQPTRHALVLRVRSGDLAEDRPVLQIPGLPTSQEQSLPALVITAHDRNLNFGSVTKFGRGSVRKVMLPDLVMTEPIASRSHFNIVYDSQKQTYQLMDAGSKWGTFFKIGLKGQPMSCCDWLHLGNAELVVRFCGGSCKAHKRHAALKRHSLRLARPTFAKSSCPWGESRRRFSLPWHRHFGDFDDDSLLVDRVTDDEADEDNDSALMEQASDMVAGRPFTACISTSQKMCRQGMSVDDATKTNVPKTKLEHGTKPPVSLPIPPLELDFISGPRMGERIQVTDRICTVGRCESNTIQLNDPSLPNISKRHCVLEYSGTQWVVKDHKSTNGTWRRLSCVLEPSAPVDLKAGVSFMAGIHEFQVEEAELPRWCVPSTAGAVLDSLCAAKTRG